MEWNMNFSRLSKALLLSLLLSFSYAFVAHAQPKQANSVVEKAAPKQEDLLIGHNQTQTIIINKINLCAKKYHKDIEEKLLEKIDTKGCCHGFTVLWLYYKWLKTKGPTDSKHNVEWFKNTIETLCNWDEEKELLPEEVLNIKDLIYLIGYFQYNQIQPDLRNLINQLPSVTNRKIKLETHGKILNKEYTIAAAFTHEQLANLLKDITKDNKLIEINFFNSKRMGSHVVGLFKNENKYYYYDSNRNQGDSPFDDISKIALAVHLYCKLYYHDDRSAISERLDLLAPVAITVYGFDGDSAEYPEQKKYLENLNRADLPEGFNMLLAPAHIGCLVSLRFFLTLGNDDINGKSILGDTPLLLASKNGHTFSVIELLSKGTDIVVNEANEKGMTPLLWASLGGHLEIVKLLLKNGADANLIGAQDEGKNTPLKVAAEDGYVAVVEVLLENKADINRADSEGNTALMVAADNGHIDVVDLLLTNKASVDLKNKAGETAFMRAASNGHAAVVSLFLDKCKDKITQEQINTALRLASQDGYSKVVGMLFAAGANMSADNYRSLIVACVGNHEAVVSEFFKKSYYDVCLTLKNMEGSGSKLERIVKTVDVLKKWLKEHQNANNDPLLAASASASTSSATSSSASKPANDAPSQNGEMPSQQLSKEESESDNQNQKIAAPNSGEQNSALSLDAELVPKDSQRGFLTLKKELLKILDSIRDGASDEVSTQELVDKLTKLLNSAELSDAERDKLETLLFMIEKNNSAAKMAKADYESFSKKNDPLSGEYGDIDDKYKSQLINKESLFPITVDFADKQPPIKVGASSRWNQLGLSKVGGFLGTMKLGFRSLLTVVGSH